MKIEMFDLNNITIYLNKEYLSIINFNFEENVEKEFKKLFLKIKDIYNLKIKGYYEVTVYINDIYGVIIEMEQEDDEYIKLFGETLDMKIRFKFDSDIYYKLEEFKDYKLDNYHLYFDDKNFYIELLDDIEYEKYLDLIENSTILYGENLCLLKDNLEKII